MIGFSAVERYSFFDGLYHADFYGPFAMRFMVKGPFPRPCGTTGETMGKNFIYALPLFVVRWIAHEVLSLFILNVNLQTLIFHQYIKIY